ncbi:MAG: peptidoglycan DD-metalloendopeptidase family protein [Bacteroidales bacterium]|nr:peptidoglycan DD-metalloendopeptidase family protein [Bacteroidales bacterium]
MTKGCFFLFLLWICTFSITAQKKENIIKYKKAQEKIEQEIQFLNDEISRIAKSQKNLYDKAIMLSKQISLYEQYLSSINNDILLISEQIHEKDKMIFHLEQNIEIFRIKLKALIKVIYLLRSPTSRLAFLFGSTSLQMAYNKYLYMNHIRRKIIKLIEQLRDRMTILQKEKEHLLTLQDEKFNTQKKLLASIEKYQQLLQEQSKLRTEAKRKEKELRRQLEIKKNEVEKLNKKIQKLIAASETSSYGSKNSPTPSTQKDPSITSKSEKKNSSFINQRGSLPWPVNGTIIGYFGEQSHPLLEDIHYKNNGIDILCKNNSIVRAVFEGIATQVVPLENDNFLVIIRHEDYLTVYTQLTEVFVEAGNSVSADQPIGKITKKDNAVVHFEIWHEKTPLNPLDWLKK